LVDDLKLRLTDPEPPKPVAPPAPAPPAAAPETPASPADVAGQVSVSVDKIARPGTMVSGSVTFSDGANADWYLDQTGRLGVVPKVQGYKPTQADVRRWDSENSLKTKSPVGGASTEEPIQKSEVADRGFVVCGLPAPQRESGSRATMPSARDDQIITRKIC
jgi:hypothetical protein